MALLNIGTPPQVCPLPFQLARVSSWVEGDCQQRLFAAMNFSGKGEEGESRGGKGGQGKGQGGEDEESEIGRSNIDVT